MEIVFATHNKNKLKEIRNKLENKHVIIGLTDIGFNDDIPEDYNTLQENALQKAETVFNRTGKNCFADDTGLEIEALNGAPGVFSARYAGAHCNSNDNIDKVLRNLSDETNRNAQFRTVICLIVEGKKHFFEGKVEGIITLEKSGIEGFGYDPIFKPLGYSLTFAEMSLADKNKISHRARAFDKMLKFLTQKD